MFFFFSEKISFSHSKKVEFLKNNEEVPSADSSTSNIDGLNNKNNPEEDGNKNEDEEAAIENNFNKSKKDLKAQFIVPAQGVVAGTPQQPNMSAPMLSPIESLFLFLFFFLIFLKKTKNRNWRINGRLIR